MSKISLDTGAIVMQAFSSEDTYGEEYSRHAYERVVGLQTIKKHLETRGFALAKPRGFRKQFDVSKCW